MPKSAPVCARRVALTALAAIALSACGSEPTLPSNDNPTVPITIPMQLEGAHASIAVTINGRSARMLLDTGSDQIVLTPAATERLGLPLHPTTVPGSGASGTYTASVTEIVDLGVGTIHRRKLTAYVVPVPEEFVYDGVLGVPFFATLLATLDYQRGALTLQASPVGTTQLPIKVEGGKLLVMASAAGVTGWFSIDTGAGNALTFFSPAVEQYGLSTAFAPSVHTITGVSPGGYTRGTLVRVPDVTIGPYALSQVVIELSEAKAGLFASRAFTGNLGGELWRRFRVTLDIPHQQLWLTPNDALTAHFEGPRSGLVASRVRSAIEIIDVAEDSPASEAGLHIGDTLIALNGTSVSFEELTQALKAPAGTPIRLTVRNSSGTEADATLVLRELL